MDDRQSVLYTEHDEEQAVAESLEQSRRGFLTKAGILGGAAFAVASAGAWTQAASAAPSAKGDIGILNFALGLEELEAEFYLRASRGEFGRLAPGVLRFAQVVHEHEMEHVGAIRATIPKLGGKAIAKPKLKFPKLDPKTFLRTAIVLEQTGVSAYGGAFPALKLKPVKEAALAIHSVEARHAAWARDLAGTNPAPKAFWPALTAEQVSKRAAPFFA